MVNEKNIDYDEVKKFDEISSQWWDKEGKFKPLHQINPIRLKFITDHVNLHNLNVLDVGCGGGILTEALYENGAKAFGIDLSKRSISVAQEHAKNTAKTIDYACCSIEDLAQTHTGPKFDVISCMELLEHVPDPEMIIASCYTLLKKDGLLFLSTINRNFLSYIEGIIAAEYILNLVPKGTHHFNKFIKPSELSQILRKSNFYPIDIIGFSYNILSRTYFSWQKATVNYMMAAKKNL